MIEINFSNVEELILVDRELVNSLNPELFSYYEQWRLAKQFPFMRQLGKAAMLDFMNALRPEDIQKIEEVFGERVFVEKLHYDIVRNVKIPLDKLCDELCEVIGFDYCATWRDDQYLYISFWR